MKNYKIAAFILLIVLFLSCAEETAAPYVPQITNFWKQQNDESHTFIFNDQNSGTSKGSFSGSEDYGDSTFFGSELSGVYNNRDIDFTIQRPTGAYRYYGKIVNDNRMELNSIKGKIVIFK
jgi:hypothetical protein